MDGMLPCGAVFRRQEKRYPDIAIPGSLFRSTGQRPVERGTLHFKVNGVFSFDFKCSGDLHLNPGKAGFRYLDLEPGWPFLRFTPAALRAGQ